MKKYFITPFSLLLSAVLLVGCQLSPAQDEAIIDNTHNARNSLDWDGTYQGVLPCADCEGIDYQLTLNSDLSFTLSLHYQTAEENRFNYTGHFSWNAAGNIIQLTLDDQPQYYFVGENHLLYLDADQQPITGKLAHFYRLTKQ